jgi:hypothetical protein
MRQLLGKRNLGGLFLAAITAGGWSVPAVAAQSDSAQTPKQTIHKTHTATSTTHRSTAPAGSSRSANSKSTPKKKVKKVKGQAAPTPERIIEIQQALAKNGVYAGDATGKWDDSTTEAMKRFQTSNGLAATGKLDALTLERLGLGSETAGLAAPTLPPNSTNRLRNLSSSATEPTDSN